MEVLRVMWRDAVENWRGALGVLALVTALPVIAFALMTAVSDFLLAMGAHVLAAAFGGMASLFLVGAVTFWAVSAYQRAKAKRERETREAILKSCRLVSPISDREYFR